MRCDSPPLEAFASTLLTVCLGLPIAWGLGATAGGTFEQNEPCCFFRLSAPPIVAAVGFLALLSPDGLIYRLGIDMR